MDNWRLISIKHWYHFMDTYCLRMSIAKCPCIDIPAWISIVWLSTTCMDNWRLASKNHGYQCWYPWIFEIHVWICYGFLDQGCNIFFRHFFVGLISLKSGGNIVVVDVFRTILMLLYIFSGELRHCREQGRCLWKRLLSRKRYDP